MSQTELHLVLKAKWYDMIESGVKKEEYREIKEYWLRRLLVCNSPEEYKGENKIVPQDIEYDVLNGHDPMDTFKSYHCEIKKFDTVTFQNGYSKTARRMTFKCDWIGIGEPFADWSDNWQGEVFVIKIGNRIN